MILLDLLKKLIENKGSDLHLIAGLYPHIQVDGILNPLTEFDRLTPESAKNLIYGILTEEQKNNFEKDLNQRYELDFAYGISRLGRFRINIHKQRGTVAATIRGLADSVPTLAELSLPESIKAFAQAKKGLMLVTGPSGSGKSTTLAAIQEKLTLKWQNLS